jgi:hypothetical protein
MKLEIVIRSTAYETTYEAAAKDPDNAGMTPDAIAWQQGQNQSATSIEAEVDVEFEIEKDEEGTIEGFVDDFNSEHKLEGAYKIGDTLERGTYYFDGKQVIRVKK